MSTLKKFFFKALLTHILSTLFSSTSVLFSCTPFCTKSPVIHIHRRTKEENKAAGDATHACLYDLAPKGVQEKRTEVLENQVDRM